MTPPRTNMKRRVVGGRLIRIVARTRGLGTDVRMPSPFTLAEAISIVDDWLAEPNFSILGAGAQHWKILARLLPDSQARGPLVIDAHLAALEIEHGATLYSNDRDFSRFSGLKFANPLAEG